MSLALASLVLVTRRVRVANGPARAGPACPGRTVTVDSDPPPRHHIRSLVCKIGPVVLDVRRGKWSVYTPV